MGLSFIFGPTNQGFCACYSKIYGPHSSLASINTVISIRLKFWNLLEMILIFDYFTVCDKIWEVVDLVRGLALMNYKTMVFELNPWSNNVGRFEGTKIYVTWTNNCVIKIYGGYYLLEKWVRFGSLGTKNIILFFLFQNLI